MNVILENWLVIVHGLRMTLALAGAVLICTTLISLVLGVLATLPNCALRWIIHGYVELFRSIPLVVNVFFVFFGAPLLGLDLSPFLAATVGLSLWGGANGTVIVQFNAITRVYDRMHSLLEVATDDSAAVDHKQRS